MWPAVNRRMDDWVNLDDMDLSTVDVNEYIVDANGNKWDLSPHVLIVT